MSAPQYHNSNNNECHQGSENSNDDVHYQELDSERFQTVMSHNTDTPKNDTETIRSASLADGIDAESVQSLQDDMTVRIASTSFALTVKALYSGEVDHGDMVYPPVNILTGCCCQMLVEICSHH